MDGLITFEKTRYGILHNRGIKESNHFHLKKTILLGHVIDSCCFNPKLRIKA
jgi:hypothetical protein